MTDSTSRPLFVAAGLTLGLALAGERSASAANPKLLVFLHVALKQRAFQSLLEGALSGVDVTAVGRIGDFERALSEGQDAVLTLPIVLDAKHLSPALRGSRNGANDERYSLVAVDNAPDASRVKSVGALDVLGREGTNAFVGKLLGSDAKVERVTKVEDLLPLLQMQRVDAIVLPSRLVSDLKSASRINLVQKELGATVALPAAASTGAAGAAALAAISRMPANVSKTMGVDAWR